MSGMEIEFNDMLNETIKRFKWTGYDGYGRPVHASTFTTYFARVDYHAKKKRDRIRDATQIEKIQSATIWVNTTESFSLEDIVVIKENFRPRILDVESFPDESETYHHVKLTCDE